MTTTGEKIARRRLEWIEGARQGILRAVGDDVVHPQFQAFPTTDPLKFLLKITLVRPLAKTTRSPLRTYLRCWAQKYDCELPTIAIDDKTVTAEILTKYRHWTGDERPKPKEPKRRFGRGP